MLKNADSGVKSISIADEPYSTLAATTSTRDGRSGLKCFSFNEILRTILRRIFPTSVISSGRDISCILFKEEVLEATILGPKSEIVLVDVGEGN